MKLHLIKLCVGANSLADLIHWRRQAKKAGKKTSHITRHMPKRKDELLNGGSLYWVIGGQIQARQVIDDIVAITDESGISKCQLIFGNKVIPTRWQARRAFQGWRYLENKDAPPDLKKNEMVKDERLKMQLAELGLL